MAEAQDVDTLKRRGRRRLVGAIALALLAVIVLPMVFDAEPRRSVPPVSVRVPGEDDTPFKPKTAAKAPEAPSAAEAPKSPAKAPEAPSAAEPPKAEPRAKGQNGAQYIVPVGAFANPDAVIAKLKQAKVPHYTEAVSTAKGKMVRVRAGPFASKEAADRAAETLKGLGLSPGAATPRAG